METHIRVRIDDDSKALQIFRMEIPENLDPDTDSIHDFAALTLNDNNVKYKWFEVPNVKPLAMALAAKQKADKNVN